MFCKDLQFQFSGSYSDTDPSKFVFRRSLRCLGEWKLGSSWMWFKLEDVQQFQKKRIVPAGPPCPAGVI